MTDQVVKLQHHAFVKAVARGLRMRCGMGQGTKVLVAVSGGADSVALLRAMAMLAPRRRWGLELMVGHVQHHLRPPEEAEGDAQFVEALASELGLAFVRVDIDVAVDAQASNVEAAARRERYRALDQIAGDAGFDFIVTAHHGDDQLETLLMRMLRGASVKGMRGIVWRRKLKSGRGLVRPMLECTREQVRDFLQELEQPWREDKTNNDRTRFRARLRAQVLPVLQDICKDSPRKATQLAGHLADMAKLLDHAVDQAWALVREEQGGWVIGRDQARGLERVVLTGLLRRVLIEAGVDEDQLGGRVVGPVVRAIGDGKGGQRRFEMSGGVRVLVTRGGVRVEGAGACRVDRVGD